MSDFESTKDAIESASSLSRTDFVSLTRAWISKHGKHESDKLLDDLSFLPTDLQDPQSESSLTPTEILDSETHEDSQLGDVILSTHRRNQENRKEKREASGTRKPDASPRVTVTPEVADVADIVRSLFGDAGRSDVRVSWVDESGGRFVKINNNELNVLKSSSGIRRRRLESAFYAKLDKTLKSHDITPGTGKGTYHYGQPQKHAGRHRLR